MSMRLVSQPNSLLTEVHLPRSSRPQVLVAQLLKMSRKSVKIQRHDCRAGFLQGGAITGLPGLAFIDGMQPFELVSPHILVLFCHYFRNGFFRPIRSSDCGSMELAEYPPERCM